MAKSIMIQGTMSNAGKSIITAGLCRIFAQMGYKTAPFKSQNMALNSFITKDGLEMGRAQAVQAEAAGIEPSVLMNPILLKPTNDTGSQIIVNGEVVSTMGAADYFKFKEQLIPDIMKAYNELSEEFDIIVIEGAGSPAEINLKDNDIVNMGLAKMTSSPVLLVGDIDRGGVFAQLAGTVSLLDEDEQALIKGMIINKFRGDAEILKPGLTMLEDITKKEVIGVVPYIPLNIDDEDSLSSRFDNTQSDAIDIAVIHFPRISNFTDFNIFSSMDNVSVRYVKTPEKLGNPDMIILPGTKSTISDLLWMRQNGLEASVLKHADKGVPIFGICGGYQMLGDEICDEIEEKKTVRGMRLLPLKTRFLSRKRRTRVNGIFENTEGIFAPLNGVEFEGYEIHMGKSDTDRRCMCKFITGKSDGISKGNIYGSYIHGIFDKCAGNIIDCLCQKKGIDAPRHIDKKTLKEAEYDKLADLLRENLDIDKIIEIINKGGDLL